MSDVTLILQKIEGGDPSASNQLLPLVYDDLHKLAAVRMAQKSPDHTLQATALVHAAYVRLVDIKRVQRWDSRGHFHSAAAEAMRRILVESAPSACIRQMVDSCSAVTLILRPYFNPPMDFAAAPRHSRPARIRSLRNSFS